MKELSIILVAYNKFNFTKSILADLAFLPKNTTEIIVIDNASTDETNAELSKRTDIIYVQNKENMFHSAACNQGYRISTGNYILMLNNDTRIKYDHSIWIKTLIDMCESTKGFVGPTMGLLDDRLNFVREADEQLLGNSYLSGWCIAAKREVWNMIDIDSKGQVWNEKYPMYFNDVSLSFRARQKSIPLSVVKLPLVHFKQISAKQLNIPKLYTEGRQVFIKEWGNKT